MQNIDYCSLSSNNDSNDEDYDYYDISEGESDQIPGEALAY